MVGAASKTTRTEACVDTWDSQQTSLMNEVYEMESTVSIQSEDRQAEQYRDCSVTQPIGCEH